MSVYSLESSKVSAFPAVRRSYAYQKDSRQFNEKNIINIINKISDNIDYVITDTSVTQATDPIEFVVGGYYFKVQDRSYITSLFTYSVEDPVSIYAYIEIDNGNDYPELSGQDEDDGTGISRYYGIKFSNTKSATWDTDPNIHYILLFEKIAGTEVFVIPSASKEKFTQDAVEGLPELQENFDTHATDLIPGTSGSETKDTIHTTTSEKTYWNTAREKVEREIAISYATIPTTGWQLVPGKSSNDYFVEVVVPGCLSTDVPDIATNISDGASAKNIKKAFASIYKAETLDGKIKFFSIKVPTYNIPVIIKGIKL